MCPSFDTVGPLARTVADAATLWSVLSGRAVPAPGLGCTSLSILVRGRFRLTFPDGEALLVTPGDYALWPPGVAHGWTAEEDCVVVTVRWPSRRDDQAEHA